MEGFPGPGERKRGNGCKGLGSGNSGEQGGMWVRSCCCLHCSLHCWKGCDWVYLLALRLFQAAGITWILL